MANLCEEIANCSYNPDETRGKVIRCKAAVAWDPEKPLVIQDIQVAPPQRLEVRIKVLYTSICHTDLSYWLGENEAHRVFPRILGHEASGIIESVGEGVWDLKEGDKVFTVFNGECGLCTYCKSEKTNLCETYRVDPEKITMINDNKTRFSTLDGQPIYHFLNTSTFSSYTVLPSACVSEMDPSAPLMQMCLLSCGVTSGVGAAWNVADVQEDSTVAIFGLGTVGLAVCQGARSRGASRIIGVDCNPDKFAIGKKMGITHFININNIDKPVHEKIRDIVPGGVDYSFECVGKFDCLRDAYLSTHDGWGLTVLIGIYPTSDPIPILPMELFDGRRLVASVFGNFKPKSQLPFLAFECSNGVVELDAFITHSLPFERINDAFQLLQEGKSLRCVLRVHSVQTEDI